DSCQRALWPGDGANPILDVPALAVDEHLEQFFTALGVVCERPVREPERILAIGAADVVQHPSAVQGPKPEMAKQHGDVGSDLDRLLCWKRLHPADVEVRTDHGGAA